MKRVQPQPRGLNVRLGLLSLTGLATAALFLTLAVGCESSSTPVATPKRVPFSGIVKVDGEPLVGAIVVFNPEDTTTGTLTHSNTDENGKYELTYQNFPGGTAPGAYKVMISYLVSPEGEPQNLSVRSALQMPPSMIGAKERLPKKYSDLGVTELLVTVPAEGGTHNFDLKGPLLPAPPPPVKAEGEEPKSDSAEKTDQKPAEEPKSETPKTEAEKNPASSEESKPVEKSDPPTKKADL